MHEPYSLIWKQRHIGRVRRTAGGIAADAIRICREILSLACVHALISLHSNSCDLCFAVGSHTGPAEHYCWNTISESVNRVADVVRATAKSQYARSMAGLDATVGIGLSTVFTQTSDGSAKTIRTILQQTLTGKITWISACPAAFT